MNLHDLKQRRDAITTRLLEIAAELAEMKRAWLADHAATDHAHRATLEAEQAALELERHQLRMALGLFGKAERKLRDATAHAVLIGLLNERGQGELVQEAYRLAIERQAMITGAAHAA